MYKNHTIDLGQGKVKIEFTKKSLTPYGGFSLLGTFFDRIRLKEAIEKIFPVKERSNNRLGIFEKILAHILTVFAGGERFSHMLNLNSGTEIFSKMFDVGKLPQSASTITRIFNKIDTFRLAETFSENIWNYMKSLILWEEIKADWLSFDSTVIERYGEQEGSKKGYNPKKKGRNSHNPLLAFLNESKYVLNIWNRSGDSHSSNNIIAFFNSIYDRIAGLIKIKGVLADSGFYNRAFIELLEEKKVTYIISAALFRNLQQSIYSYKDWISIDKGICIGEIMFHQNEWEKDRRYIIIRQDSGKRENAVGKQLKLFESYNDDNTYRYTAYITNSNENAYDVWKSIRQRSNDENKIKELKEDFALGGYCMESF